MATPGSVAAQQAMGIEATSDTRGGAPFHPLLPDGSPSSLVEVPSTLPTLDELLSLDEFGSSGIARERTVEHLVRSVRESPGLHVHSIHTEIEGGNALHALFASQLRAWKADGVRFVTLGESVKELRAAGVALPGRSLVLGTLPGRATPVTKQGGTGAVYVEGHRP